MKKQHLLFALSIFILFLSCKSEGVNKPGDSEADNKELTTEVDVKEQEVQTFTNVMPIPGEIFKKVYQESDQMDGIFEELPFSMSQETNASIQQLLNHVDTEAPKEVSTECPLFAQQTFLIGGTVILEADLYCSEGCYYYAFKYDGKRYFNKLLPAGITFYENLKTQRF